MARVLIVGCGCRGRALARSLLAGGHAVRGTTRDPERAAEIAASGAEPFVGDPARVGTLTPALDGVAVVCLLLGSATGTPRELETLHGSRLEMMLLRIIDTTVRAVAYEAVGTVEQPVLDARFAEGARCVPAVAYSLRIASGGPGERRGLDNQRRCGCGGPAGPVDSPMRAK